MSDSTGLSQTMTGSAAIGLSRRIMAVGTVLLFLVIIFILFLHLYTKWFLYRQEEPPTTTTALRRRIRRRLNFVPGRPEPASATGLDPTLLKSLPLLIFNPKDFKDGLECAVCLSEVVQGEKARLLPKCNHGFHLDCIDMWFQSHSTCPLCRTVISNRSSTAPPELTLELILRSTRAENSAEPRSFPTNVLFCRDQSQNQSQGTTSSLATCSSSPSSSTSNGQEQDGMSVIDIPSQIVEDEEEPKSRVSVSFDVPIPP